MRIITRKRILNFVEKHNRAKKPLDVWYRIVKKTVFKNFDDLRKTYPSADLVGKFTVFNIGGNKYRLIAYIVYEAKKVFIHKILTHNDYDKNQWKEDK